MDGLFWPHLPASFFIRLTKSLPRSSTNRYNPIYSTVSLCSKLRPGKCSFFLFVCSFIVLIFFFFSLLLLFFGWFFRQLYFKAPIWSECYRSSAQAFGQKFYAKMNGMYFIISRWPYEKRFRVIGLLNALQPFFDKSLLFALANCTGNKIHLLDCSLARLWLMHSCHFIVHLLSKSS